MKNMKFVRILMVLSLCLVLVMAASAMAEECEHNWKAGKPATCTEPGNKICTLCGTVEATPAGGAHVWKDGKPATCVAEGNKICTLCGAVEATPASGNHAWKDGLAPTCAVAGNKICTLCGEVEIIPTVPHTWKDGLAPTCAKEGNKLCTVCGAVELVEKLPHTEEVVAGKVPTCTATGLTDGKKCSVCGEVTLAQKEIAKLPHTEEVVKGYAATCTETGMTDGKKCSVCGEITLAQEVIAALGHTEEVIPAVAPDCVNTGLTAGSKCTVCGVITLAQEVVPALGHTEEVIPAVEPLCGVPGLTAGVKCSVCGEILKAQEDVAELTHQFYMTVFEPTEKRDGYTKHTCRFCGVYYVDTFVPFEAAEELVYGSIVTDINGEDLAYTAEVNEEKVLTIAVAYAEGAEVAYAKLSLSDELLAQFKAEEIAAIVFVNGDIKVEANLAIFESEIVTAVVADVEGALGLGVVIDPALAEQNYVDFVLVLEAGDVSISAAITEYSVSKGEELLK